MRIKGKVKWVNKLEGHGLIERDGGTDVPVRYGSLLDEEGQPIEEGQTVEFEIINGPTGLEAGNVVVLEEAGKLSGAPYWIVKSIRLQEIPDETIRAQLLNLMTTSVTETFAAGQFEDAIDYALAILALYPEHDQAKDILNRARAVLG